MAKKPTKPRRGRPPVNPPTLSERFQIRMTLEQRQHIEARAYAEGRSVSSYLQRLIVHDMGQDPDEPPHPGVSP